VLSVQPSPSPWPPLMSLPSPESHLVASLFRLAALSQDRVPNATTSPWLASPEWCPSPGGTKLDSSFLPVKGSLLVSKYWRLRAGLYKHLWAGFVWMYFQLLDKYQGAWLLGLMARVCFAL
jgi:hypothetical protein